MKKVLQVVSLCFTVCLIMLLLPDGGACAADSTRGSLGVLEGVSGEMLDKAAELTGYVDVDEEFDRVYGRTKWSKTYNKEDLKYMSCIIYCEARNMNFDARAAVGNVVLNRLNYGGKWSHLYQTSIKRVIYDTGPDGRWWGVQFSPTKDGSLKKALVVYDNLDKGTNRSWDEQDMKSAIEVAKAVLRGYKSVPDDFDHFNGHLDTQPASCEKNGWDYIIYERHVYFNKNSD